MLLAQKETAYWTATISACNGNSKRLWGCLNAIMLRDTDFGPSQPAVTADSLSKYFVSKVEAIRALTLHCSQPTFIPRRHVDLLSEFSPCSLDEVRRTIQCSPDKSCALDPLPHNLFAQSLDHLLPIIHLICNSSMLSGTLPDTEKLAIVTPILKKRDLDPDSAKSYRPISNLTFISKLIERIVSRRLTSYLSEHNLLPTVQSAYRQNHSTETASLKIVSDVLDAADTGHVTLLALLDLSAAFDTVDHNILLSRQECSYGFSGTVLKWIASYLKNRSQTVVFAGIKSAPTSLLYGVPQGSVLGPLFFNLYTADVVKIAESFGIQIHCYADDVQLYIHCLATDAPIAVARLLACIGAIDKWMGSNKLKLNADKTQLIWLGTRQQLVKIDNTPLILHDGTVIHPSTQVRTLGVILDNELTMLPHANSVVRGCFYHLRQLRSIRSSLTDSAAKTIVHALISSRIDYCNSVLFGVSEAVSQRLQSVLNSSARLITNRRRFDHITPALRDELHWLPIQQRIQYKIALLVFKCLHGLSPVYLSAAYTPMASLQDSRVLRSAVHGDIVQPRTNTRRIGPRSFRSSAPAIWNSLPAPVKNSSLTIGQFKRALKTHLFNVAYNNKIINIFLIYKLLTPLVD